MVVRENAMRATTQILLAMTVTLAIALAETVLSRLLQ
jgi:hypothetical protein